MKKSNVDLYKKYKFIKKVIESCETIEHLDVCRNMVNQNFLDVDYDFTSDGISRYNANRVIYSELNTILKKQKQKI